MKNSALFLLLLISGSAWAQAPYALLPTSRACFDDVNGSPLSGGKVYSYAAGTSTPLATYIDSVVTPPNTTPIPNSNPVILDAAGCAGIWLAATSYKIALQDTNGVPQWTTDGVSDLGALLYLRAVLLAPGSSSVEQTVLSPLGARYFHGTDAHTTSLGVRVALLDPTTTWDTPNNPFTVTATDPLAAGQNIVIPDPQSAQSSLVLNPNSDGSNTLDCNQPGLTCKRTAYVYFEGASANNATASLGWDTFGSNAPTPIVVTGNSIQKGVMALPSAATLIQQVAATGAAAGTCTAVYPAATIAGDLLEVEIGVDGGRTVTGVTDGTNAYSRATSITNGNYTLEVWYFNGNSASKAAATNLTATLSAAANCAMNWKEYSGILTASMLDKTATNSGTGTAVTSGSTVGTSQNTELVLVAAAMGGAPATITAQDGFSKHTVVSQVTNISVVSQGKIQQATATQTGNFTLSQSLLWSAAVVTFKANVAASVTAQRQLVLPGFFQASQPVNANIKWQNPLQASGAINAVLAASVICTADGNSDDPTYNAPTQANALISSSGANIISNTALTALNATGCAGSNLMHFQVRRMRYDPNDTYEGFVYVNGVAVDFGITR